MELIFDRTCYSLNNGTRIDLLDLLRNKSIDRERAIELCWALAVKLVQSMKAID